MAGRSTTAEAILAAARRTILSSGPHKITLSAVASEAGISRPTLYRWFPTKSLLLAEITAYEVEQFDAGLREVVAAHSDPGARLDAALRYLVTYLDRSMGADSIAAEPAFALQSLADSLGPHIESLTVAIGDALDRIPAVAQKIVTREQSAEMLLRVAYSHYLVPNADSERLIATLRGMIGLPSRARKRAR